MRKNGEKNYLFRWIAVILLIMELIASGNFLDMKKSSFINGLQYEISPLKIKSVVITDRRISGNIMPGTMMISCLKWL